jgi:hypothetical protein
MNRIRRSKRQIPTANSPATLLLVVLHVLALGFGLLVRVRGAAALVRGGSAIASFPFSLSSSSSYSSIQRHATRLWLLPSPPTPSPGSEKQRLLAAERVRDPPDATASASIVWNSGPGADDDDDDSSSHGNAAVISPAHAGDDDARWEERGYHVDAADREKDDEIGPSGSSRPPSHPRGDWGSRRRAGSDAVMFSPPPPPPPPFYRNEAWIEEATSALLDYPVGELSEEDVATVGGIVAAWSRRSPGSLRAALSVERLLKRVVDDVRAGNPAARVTTRLYAYVRADPPSCAE